MLIQRITDVSMLIQRITDVSMLIQRITDQRITDVSMLIQRIHTSLVDIACYVKDVKRLVTSLFRDVSLHIIILFTK